MANVLPNPKPPSDVSLALAVLSTRTHGTEKQALSRSSCIWRGSRQSGRTGRLQIAESFTITDTLRAFILTCDGPLTVTINGNDFTAEKMMVLDVNAPGITVTNVSSGVVTFDLNYLVA